MEHSELFRVCRALKAVPILEERIGKPAFRHRARMAGLDQARMANVAQDWLVLLQKELHQLPIEEYEPLLTEVPPDSVNIQLPPETFEEIEIDSEPELTFKQVAQVTQELPLDFAPHPSLPPLPWPAPQRGEWARYPPRFWCSDGQRARHPPTH
jgi:hypothetical protein